MNSCRNCQRSRHRRSDRHQPLFGQIRRSVGYRSNNHRRSNRNAGFSLAELAVVVMIVGIVAGIALPSLRSAMFRAESVRIVSDVATIRLAAFTYLSEEGSFPTGSGFGVVPPQLAPYLPDGFSFQYKDVEYGFWAFSFFGGGGFFGTNHLGIVMVSYPGQPELAEALKSHMGADALWSTTLMYFLLRG